VEIPLSRRSFGSFLGSVISESSSVFHSVLVRLYAKPRFGGAGGTIVFVFDSRLSDVETESAAYTIHFIILFKYISTF